MTEDKKVITINDKEYTEDQLTDQQKNYYKPYKLFTTKDWFSRV